ncbi:MAG TPA: sugar ABC transporter permease [Acholeplasmataceae bacterium]|jgi:multiple sugar transport system permease protein|nr:sugar ABC transporter permease [Acholeplasmataceae bacterium]
MLEFKRDGSKAAICLAPALLLMSVFTFWPIINSFIMAFLNNYYFAINNADFYNEMMSVPKSYGYFMGGRFTGIGIENFLALFRDKDFLIALKNTAFIVFVSVPITVIIALLISVALNSIKKVRGVFQTVFFLPYVTNTIALGLVFNSLFHVDYGLINKLFNMVGTSWINSGATWGRAMFVLMMYSVWDGLAFKIIVFLSGLQSIDKQYYQAAQIDATPRWRVFWRITVPLLSPMILYITITSFMGAFKVYSSVIGIFGTGRYGPIGNDKLLITIVGYVYEQFNISGMPFGVGSAGSMVLFLIILLITAVQMRVSKKWVHY